MTKALGFFKKHELFKFEGEVYEAVCVSEKKNINSVLCISKETKKRIWLDVDVEVEVIE